MKLSNDDLHKIEQVKAILENEYRNANTHSNLARRVRTNESKLRKGFKYVNNKTIYDRTKYHQKDPHEQSGEEFY